MVLPIDWKAGSARLVLRVVWCCSLFIKHVVHNSNELLVEALQVVCQGRHLRLPLESLLAKRRFAADWLQKQYRCGTLIALGRHKGAFLFLHASTRAQRLSRPNNWHCTGMCAFSTDNMLHTQKTLMSTNDHEVAFTGCFSSSFIGELSSCLQETQS